MFASLGAGRETLKSLIKVLEDEFKSADFRLNEPGAVKHRTKIPLGLWEDVYVTNLQGDLAKEVADQVGTYTQASFMGTSKNVILWILGYCVGEGDERVRRRLQSGGAKRITMETVASQVCLGCSIRFCDLPPAPTARLYWLESSLTTSCTYFALSL